MNVLIKGMKMPSNCHECPLLYVTSICDGVKDCPLIPVTDHGRLIDADEIIKDDHQHYDYLSDSFYVTVRDIELAPTIIEADKQYPEWRTQILGKPYKKDEEGT